MKRSHVAGRRGNAGDRHRRGRTAGAAAAAAAAAGPQPFFVGNRLGLPINPAADGKLRGDVAEREGLRRDLFGGELLLRSGPRR